MSIDMLAGGLGFGKRWVKILSVNWEKIYTRRWREFHEKKRWDSAIERNASIS